MVDAHELPRAGAQDRVPITGLLNDLRSGDDAAAAALLPALMAELRRLAEKHFARGAKRETLQPTALVNEAYLRLFRSGAPDWENRDHFLAVAARAMRQIMIDQARRRGSLKRGGGGQGVTLDEAMAVAAGIDLELLDLHAALEQLEEFDPGQARIVEMRYFLGLEVAEVARVLGVSKSTVEREWRAARAWLGQQIGKGKSDE